LVRSSFSIPLSEPNLAGSEWQYVKDCLDRGEVAAAGGYVERFERELAAQVEARFAVATSSGTAALHVSLLIAGVQPDDEVVLPSLTFIAPANAVRYAAAWPTFIDVENEYWQMDAGQLETFLREDCERSGGPSATAARAAASRQYCRSTSSVIQWIFLAFRPSRGNSTSR
jgi:perosamine synthetase